MIPLFMALRPACYGGVRYGGIYSRGIWASSMRADSIWMERGHQQQKRPHQQHLLSSPHELELVSSSSGLPGRWAVEKVFHIVQIENREIDWNVIAERHSTIYDYITGRTFDMTTEDHLARKVAMHLVENENWMMYRFEYPLAGMASNSSSLIAVRGLGDMMFIKKDLSSNKDSSHFCPNILVVECKSNKRGFIARNMNPTVVSGRFSMNKSKFANRLLWQVKVYTDVAYLTYPDASVTGIGFIESSKDGKPHALYRYTPKNGEHVITNKDFV